MPHHKDNPVKGTYTGKLKSADGRNVKWSYALRPCHGLSIYGMTREEICGRTGVEYSIPPFIDQLNDRLWEWIGSLTEAEQDIEFSVPCDCPKGIAFRCNQENS